MGWGEGKSTKGVPDRKQGRIGPLRFSVGC
uniref:Uncharacterized protein n=1 Tax=Human herpesvirus 2 TaxID=10310 RepID=A0A481TCY9_HHV2|nr:hypothetical protein [Human alphaherpesvirus 2]